MRQPTFSAATRPRKFGFQGAGRFGFQTKTTPFASRAFSPDCEPQRAFRGQPPQAALRPRSRLCATLGQDAPHGRGGKGSIRLAPDQTDRRRAPSSGLLGWRRSAAYAATTLRAASRARGQRPLPVCPTPASWEARPDRAQSSGVLRHSPGRAGGACLGKKQVGAGCDMRVPSTQPKAGTLPGDT